MCESAYIGCRVTEDMSAGAEAELWSSSTCSLRKLLSRRTVQCEALFSCTTSFLLFPYKSIIDHGLRLNTRPNMPLGQLNTAILMVGRDIYLDFKRIWKEKKLFILLHSTELSLNETTKQEVKMRDNSEHLTPWVHTLQQIPATWQSQKSHLGFTVP